MGDNCVASIYSHVNGMNNNKISKQETTNVFQRLKFLKSWSVLFLYRYRCDYVFISKTTYLFDLPFTYNDTCCKQLLIHIRISAFRFAFSFIWQRGLRSNENFEIYYLLHAFPLLNCDTCDTRPVVVRTHGRQLKSYCTFGTVTTTVRRIERIRNCYAPITILSAEEKNSHVYNNCYEFRVTLNDLARPNMFWKEKRDDDTCLSDLGQSLILPESARSLRTTMAMSRSAI